MSTNFKFCIILIIGFIIGYGTSSLNIDNLGSTTTYYIYR